MDDYTLMHLCCGDGDDGGGDGDVMAGGGLHGVSRGGDGLLSCLFPHISAQPTITVVSGGSMIIVRKKRGSNGGNGGRRGAIKGFSWDSRIRLLMVIARVRRDAPLPLFLTLTYPDRFPEPLEAKKHFNMLLWRIGRKFKGAVGLIWKLEPQQRGAPHFHCLVWGVKFEELFPWVAFQWYEIAGGGDERHLKWHLGAYDNEPCVGQVRSWRGVWSYASKYLGKTFEVAEWGDKWTGRYWGVRWPQNIPFGQERVIPIDFGKAVEIMRYQRRFSHAPGRDYAKLVTFCNADLWRDKLLGGDI